MKCIKCNCEIEEDDNFCYNCGFFTATGYTFFKNKNNQAIILKGAGVKQQNKMALLITLLCVGLIMFIFMFSIKGTNLFAPFAYLKKQINNYIYGYNTSVIKTDNIYNNINVETVEEARKLIKKDFKEQEYICDRNLDLALLETTIEEDYDIPSVAFCDISYQEAIKINEVIKKVYLLFPNIEGALTNLTITNAKTNSEYVARFQPLYQFINVNEDINKFNKVNKTQILLNSYYYLNDDIMNNKINDVIKKEWYVEDATWESLIAHELGHYITFKCFLNDNNISNITLVTKDNYQLIDNLLNKFTNKDYSKLIVTNALENYNKNYNKNINIFEFANSISKYASVLDNNNLNYDETIAEAIHDYYLHGNNSKSSSLEIVKIIKEKLG